MATDRADVEGRPGLRCADQRRAGRRCQAAGRTVGREINAADTAITMDLAKKLRDDLPNCVAFVEIEGGAHAANLTHPDQLNPPLLEFLRKYA